MPAEKIDWQRLAREAAEYALKYYKPHGPLAYAYENVRNKRFARLVLEEAAKVADAQAKEPECPERAQYIAEAIRSMKP